ncbi:MAG: Gfo/Idh/MocA family oxidoreductase [Saprospiraceae bacterium]|nr:Gfo/Idh/MocA family oxidoreductase [Saprospiraceae bacterium]
MKRVKIGVAGVGHLGKIHVKCIKEVPELELVGFYDPDSSRAQAVSSELQVPSFTNLDELIDSVDALDIVTPTLSHHLMAAKAMGRGKHVFIEKPVTATVQEGEDLLKTQREMGVIAQVGHVERFNPAMLAIQQLKINPKFIEVHRLANFNPRGTDVSVVLDLMIHDLDIILKLVPSRVKRIFANGVCLVSRTPDIGNARIEWENGCVANVTASRMSFKNMRKMRIFQPDAYIGLDFLERTAQIIRMEEGPLSEPATDINTFELETADGIKTVRIEMPETQPVNAIQMELECFARSILENQTPEVGIEAALDALRLAFNISEEIQQNLDKALA